MSWNEGTVLQSRRARVWCGGSSSRRAYLLRSSNSSCEPPRGPIALAWAEARVALEFDGFVKYSGRLGAAPEVLFAEKRRQDALEAAGWLIIRVTWADLTNLDATILRIRRALSARSPR
jgi:hypothetical protein